jgi:hypothetical protein
MKAMDKLKKYLEEYYDIDLNDERCNAQLLKLIQEYGNDQWQEGSDYGFSEGYDNASDWLNH